MTNTNWAGNHTYPSIPWQPTSEEELAELLLGAAGSGQRVRAVGSRHSFNAIADAPVMVDLSRMPEIFEPRGDSVRVNAAMTYGRLAELLKPLGLAVHNLASLPHISVAGAISTGTHGSGSRNGNLATAVREVFLHKPGEQFVVGMDAEPGADGDRSLNATAVGLGAVGVIVAVTLRVQPAYEIEQRVFEDLGWQEFLGSIDRILDSAYSVSAFTRWVGDGVEQIWVKRRTDEPDDSALLIELGGISAIENRHPIRELSAEACTEQMGVPGLWSDRLPHFKMEFTPSAGEEIQSEYFVGRPDAVAAIAALRSIADEIADALLISEIRTIAADEISMSPCYRRDSIAFHFTWGPDQKLAEAASARVLRALEPFQPRPHWGKVFPVLTRLRDRYPNYEDYLHNTVVDGVLVNDWFSENLEPMPFDAKDPLPPAIPPIGLGTFGSDHVPHDAVAAAVQRAVVSGYRFIDCASVYGNEANIGSALAAITRDREISRQELYISSKVWNDQHDSVLAACRQSLVDLGLNYLDLYLVHWPFPNHHPPHCDVDERNPEAQPYSHDRFMATWRQMEDLVDRGLVRAIGTSNMTISKLERLLEDARIRPTVNQMELHPHFQQPELFDYLTANNIQAIGFCPIGSPARPERDRTPHDSSPTEDQVIVELAERYGVHPAVICVRWAQQRGQIPIPFSTTPGNLESNLHAAERFDLTAEEMRAIAAVDRNNRLIKGQVFLWPEATDWTDLWI